MCLGRGYVTGGLRSATSSPGCRSPWCWSRSRWLTPNSPDCTPPTACSPLPPRPWLAAPVRLEPLLTNWPDRAHRAAELRGAVVVVYGGVSPEFVAAAAPLALLVGVIRVGLGVVGLGGLAYFLSQPVLKGFTTGAAVLIFLSQLPATLGFSAQGRGVLGGVADALSRPGNWNPTACGLALLTLLIVLGGRRVSARFPGVLVAVLAGIGLSLGFGFAGPTVGDAGATLPALSFTQFLTLPWREFPNLFLGAAIVAVVGFAEPAAIARTFAGEQPGRWNPNRELVSQGAANLAAGLVGTFPVGGSFSRSSLNKLAGAKTRWSGLVTGLGALAFLPFAGLLAPLPKAVLAAVVMAAVVNLLDVRGLIKLWRYARLQALTAYATFVLTLLLAPRVDYAVLLGIGLAVVAHLYREAKLGVRAHRDGDTLTLVLSGVLWFGSAHQLEAAFERLLEAHQGVSSLVLDAAALGRVDLSGSLLLAELIERAHERGLAAEVRGLEPHMQRVLGRVQEGEHFE